MTQPQESPPNPLIQFHDLVALINQKIWEVQAAAGGELSDKDRRVINYFEEFRERVVSTADGCGISYVYTG